MKKILVIGAAGQVGVQLVTALRTKHGVEQVIASDLRANDGSIAAPYHQLDATDEQSIRACIIEHRVTDVYLMAAMLSATAEMYPMKAWKLNMDSLFIVLEAAKEGLIKRIFWPSSIAVFGPDSTKVSSPQQGVLEPTTVYGISKSVGEDWCAYYFRRYGVDVRSLRYPGLIGWQSKPGGGTTDYAVHIFYSAAEQGKYTCFLSPGRRLPMMHMDDAIRATIELMEAPSEHLRVRRAYNLSGMDFTPAELAEEIQTHLPEFEIDYALDSRDEIARSWPESIDDSPARNDWGWKPRFDLKSLVKDMMSHIGAGTLL